MNKKDLGAFYTPKHTANYMLGLLSDFDERSKLLEPCGGDGAFVSVILEKKLLKPNQITVWDINPEVKNYIEKFGVVFNLKDSLLETTFKEEDLFNKIKKFTHIVGNPPYLNKQSSYIKKNKNKLRKIYDEIGANDTYALFIYLCCHLLEDNGQLCFITSDTYLTLGIHKKLRKFLLANFIVKKITLCPSDLFKGGLGMHTADNKKFLGIIDYNGIKYAKNGIQNIVSIDEAKKDGWKFYHKKGGDTKYYLPAEFCIKWDKESIKNYKMPKNFNLNDDRQGFLISGVCSTISARLATKGALWESNKAMCFFPKDPVKYPPEFFVGILNGDLYNKIIKILNHTNSIQIRDIKKLPLFDFKKEDIQEIAKIAKNI